ncbi:MAG: TonB-dependent receptor, partial [Bacteroidales bacterium]|nr:TonB-dependent receptor [Bacteroidales bacterium]
MKIKQPILTLFLLLMFSFIGVYGSNVKGEFTLSGYITDSENGEYLPGATVYIANLKKGTASNIYGYYSISLKPENYQVIYSYVGYGDITMELNLTSDTSINIELVPSAKNLDEVEITGEAINENITTSQMSVNKIDSKTIKAIPALLGEVDLVKALQLLPGVKFAAEGSSGISVRGGSPDQNLILLDEANVYNAGHLMGFFSVFNNDAVKSVELYKGDLPAKYGGRLASLVDIRMKDGNTKQFHGNGGIGIISSRLMLEGPIAKDKASFMVAGRRSYADLFLIFSKDEDLKGSSLYFYDLNGKVNYRINQKNQIYLSGYYGKDVFKSDFFKMNWGNATGTLRWNHIFDEKLFSNFTFVVNQFDYNIGFTDDGPQSFLWQSSLTDYNLKANFTWFANTNNKVTFGFSGMFHDFFPGTIEGQSEESFISTYSLPDNFAMESAVYISNEQKIGTRVTLKYGLRLSIFNNIGPGTWYKYNADGDV